ncbi:MAG: restriction endonuclease FokI C-terminal domain-containing protein [Peptoniphilus harei]|uniref:restriction endonuclease FokI C-terminal domain-containing protein n=1 Tax=Peptoniphilus harei TaxID=54005 RepID=UPI0029081966|nr:restriction endonuclease FokI C-terminal domain-containing protein [Peptoniphilus harei]MDU5471395.1 restriction endonuclease FokI C-terminal domain-containing protein [Peptoniphilus harei]MDU6098711.1 restriction endonuclease FokI C-terminal domain-containing protein [Peptoniphilus harei]
MAERTLGWIQNPSSFENLKNVVSVFDKNTELYNEILNTKLHSLVEDLDLRNKLISEMRKEPLEMDYVLLKGHGIKSGQKRSDAKCSGIVQAAITTQGGRAYTDDWTADGFLRWGISIGLLDYDSEKDTVYITQLGEDFVHSDSEDLDKEILTTAFLSYPPAVRILTLLENGEHLTKFELGKQLGGLGEAGFTSIPQDLYIQAIELASETDKATIRSNTEGSADKYARMISGWLSKVGLVQRIEKEVSTNIGNIEYKVKIGHSFRITLKGIKELKRARGISSYSKTDKIVYWQMLATKGKDRDYIRNRRGHIINSITNRGRTLEDIKVYLSENDIKESIPTIEDELKVIEAMGLSVKHGRNGYSIDDNIIKLAIPRTKISKTNVLELKDKVRDRLKYVNHRYLALIDLAYDGTANKDFEIQTIDLLINELKFKGVRLGESRKPDGIISYDINGVIIDNKAYSTGYNLPINQADEMIRYIEENQTRDKKINPNKWWESFENEVKDFNYLFVSSFFKGNFKNNLKHIANRTGVNGGAINVENLLYFAEELKSGRLSYVDSFTMYDNDEIYEGNFTYYANVKIAAEDQSDYKF